jgi:hypothetical protein
MIAYVVRLPALLISTLLCRLFDMTLQHTPNVLQSAATILSDTDTRHKGTKTTMMRFCLASFSSPHLPLPTYQPSAFAIYPLAAPLTLPHGQGWACC